MRGLIAAICCLSAGACSAIGGDPLLDGMAAPSKPFACPAAIGDVAADQDDSDLCDAIAEARASSNGYLEAAKRMNAAHVAYGGVQLVSAVSLLAFSMFDAHPDNRSAATLVGAVATGARGAVKPDRQREILVDGARGMRCVAERGAVFLGGAQKARRLQTLANEHGQWATSTRTVAIAASDQPGALPLLASIGDLETVVAATRETASILEMAPHQVREGRSRVENATLSQLRAERPDYAALIAAVRAAAVPAATTASEAPPSTPLEPLDDGPTLEQLTIIARSRAAALQAEASGPAKPEYDAILNCVAQA